MAMLVTQKLPISIFMCYFIRDILRAILREGLGEYSFMSPLSLTLASEIKGEPDTWSLSGDLTQLRRR